MSPRPPIHKAPLDGVTSGVAARPQVNLLPPEIRARRALGHTKIKLAVAFLVVVLLAGLGFGYALYSDLAATRELEEKQVEVQRLLAEQAQYAEVPRIKSQIGDATSAREFGMSTEILWRDYLLAIQAVSPQGWVFSTITTSLMSPTQEPMLSANPLASVGIGQIAFGGRASTLPDLAAWVEAMDSVPGFSDTMFTSAEITEEDGTVFYEVAGSVQVDETAFALRFADEEVD